MNIIVAICNNGAIGRRGDLVHHISADLRRFKQLTTGHTVVMGRRTFESLPKGALPDRRNIVITRQDSFTAPGIEVAHSLYEALHMAAGDLIYILGGAEIYRQALPLASCLCLTCIDDSPTDADTFFPEIDPGEWTSVEETPQETDPRSGIGYKFVTLQRKNQP